MTAYIIKDLVSGKYSTAEGPWHISAGKQPRLIYKQSVADEIAAVWRQQPKVEADYLRRDLSHLLKMRTCTEAHHKSTKTRIRKLEAQVVNAVVFPIELP